MTRASILACIATSLLIVGTLSGCALRKESQWLNQHVYELNVAADTDEDLAFLKPLLANKRIVQLGENTHGVREYNLIKDRMIRYLHKELGFNVLVFESDFYQCHQANEKAGTTLAKNTLFGCAYGTWHTTGVLPLFKYLKSSHATETPLQLAGMDIQPIGRNKDHRPQFLADAVSAFDPSYAHKVFSLDSTFLAVYAQGSKARRAWFRSEDGENMLSSYNQLTTFLTSALNDLSDVQDADSTSIKVAHQTVNSISWYLQQQTAQTTVEYVENRDQGMAENLRFIAEVLYPDEKLIVWGHNFHIRHNNPDIPADSTMFPDVPARTMGYWAHSWYEDELYTIGIYAYEGEAADNGGETFSIEPAQPESLEGILHAKNKPALFVDLSNPTTYEPDWVQITTTARYNGETPLSIKVRDQYDGLIFIDQVTPRESLY